MLDAMPEHPPHILILEQKIETAELSRLVRTFFGDMVKVVVDIQRGILAVGGELHADAEDLLLESGSRQDDLWGANYYPGRDRETCIEYTALINIRPARGNRSMQVEDAATRERIRDIIYRLVGEGEPLP